MNIVINTFLSLDICFVWNWYVSLKCPYHGHVTSNCLPDVPATNQVPLRFIRRLATHTHCLSTASFYVTIFSANMVGYFCNNLHVWLAQKRSGDICGKHAVVTPCVCGWLVLTCQNCANLWSQISSDVLLDAVTRLTSFLDFQNVKRFCGTHWSVKCLPLCRSHEASYRSTDSRFLLHRTPPNSVQKRAKCWYTCRYALNWSMAVSEPSRCSNTHTASTVPNVMKADKSFTR